MSTGKETGTGTTTLTDMEKPNPVRQYFSDVRSILLRPKAFFATMPLTGGLAGPLAFGLVSNWLGTALEFLWQKVLHFATPGRAGGFVGDTVNRLFERFGRALPGEGPNPDSRYYWTEDVADTVSNWFWSVGSVIADPFFTLASILVTSGFVYAGARLFITPGRTGGYHEITYESAVRIVSFGMAPALLAGVPIVGFWVAPIYVAVVTIIGAREAYRTDWLRAIGVALFPKLLFAALGLGIVLLFFFGILQLFLFA